MNLVVLNVIVRDFVVDLFEYRMKKHYSYVFVLDMIIIHCLKLFKIYEK
jgi:hypothetical protein